MRRSADGRLELTATRATTAMRLDRVLAESAWKDAEVATGFLLSEPRDGQPATERTEVRDGENISVVAYMYGSDPSRLVANDLRKDFGLFIVYNDQRFLTDSRPVPGRSLTLKYRFRG